MTQAIIMAGGEGSRLRPLTCDRPKPMVPMLNRPVMEYAVDLLISHGITDIGVTLQYLPQDITGYFRDGSGHGVNMQYFIEEEPLGTAGSVKNAEGFIKDTFVVVSGDALTDFDLSAAIRFHKEKGAVATLVLTPVEIPLEYGVVITEKTGEIRQFLEKPGWGEVFSDTVNTGIYIFEPEVLSYIPEKTKFDFSKDLFPYLLKEQKPLFGVSLSGYWCDIGNHKQYQEAHYAAMEGRVAVKLKGDQQGHGISMGENCKIDSTAVINGPVVLGSNCRIERNAVVGPYVALGDNCMIDSGATLKKTIAWSGTYIGKQAEVRGAVLCNRVTLKDRAIVLEGAVIGDNTVIEEEAKIKPDTKVWPGKRVERGSVLNDHLIWGTNACRNLFGNDGVAGKINTDLTPECAAKLGAVYGTVVGPGSNILLSSDKHPCTRMIKTALEAGLLSVGINVIDGGDILTPVHRNSIRILGAKGGVHVKSSSTDPEVLVINFFGDNGAAISRDLERKMENQFERNDFRRLPKQDVGTVSYMPGLTEAYVQNLCRMVDIDGVRKRRHRVLVYYTENLKGILPELFSSLGCELVDGGVISEDTAISGEMLDSIAAGVNQAGADFGAVFDHNAENVILIDANGRVIDDNRFLALMTLVILETAKKPVVAVPVTGSSVVDKVVTRKQGKIIRTKTSPVSFMNEVLKDEIAGAQGSLNQSVITFDALSTIVKLMEYMAKQDISLGDLVAQLPDIFMTRKETGCPWAAKGKVMRQLIEDTKGREVELVDGVKVYHANGWALVLPDAAYPKYHVYSEGYSYEFADSLADFYINKINQLREQ